MSRRPFEPTLEQRRNVESYAAVGISHEQIALLVKHPNGEHISVDTLTKYFPDELLTGKAKTTAMIAGRLIRTALGSNEQASTRDELSAQMFYLKTQAEWRETDRHEVTFPKEGDEEDATATAARVAGLIERGLRRRKAKETPPSLQ